MIKNIIKKCILVFFIFTNYSKIYANDPTHIPGIFSAFITPSWSFTTVKSNDSSLVVKSKSSSFEWIGGINYNKVITPDKYFYTVEISICNETLSIEDNPISTEQKLIDEKHNIMRLRIAPIGFTLLTDELWILDLIAIFKFSCSCNFKMKEDCEVKNGCTKYINKIAPFGISFDVRSGLKYAIGPNTSLACGIDWSFTITNMITEHENLHKAPNAIVTGDTYMVGIYIGIWF